MEATGVEPVSENTLTQPSSWVVYLLEFPLTSADRQALDQGSPFVHDRFKSERPMHVHHCDDAQSEAVVLIGGTGDPQVAALPIFTSSDVKLRQP